MAKKKENWAQRLKKDVVTLLKGAGHSRAGKKHLKQQKEEEKKKKEKETEQVYFRGKGFSRPSAESQLESAVGKEWVERFKGKGKK